MATKKQNRREQVRRTRRVLSKAIDFFIGTVGNLNNLRYGAGLSREMTREPNKSEDHE